MREKTFFTMAANFSKKVGRRGGQGGGGTLHETNESKSEHLAGKPCYRILTVYSHFILS